LPLLEESFHKRKRSVGGSRQMDETYIEVKGVWKYLHRVVDKVNRTALSAITYLPKFE